MIYILLILLAFMRTIPSYLGNAELYWFSDSVLIGITAIYIFNKSEKTVFTLLALFCILLLAVNQAINTVFMMFNDGYIEYLPLLSKIVVSIISFLLIFRNRYTWRKQNSAEYNSDKVQAIYSKPTTILTLLGATTSLSPKCSVRYSYADETIRFKKGSDRPIRQDTYLKGDEIIEDLNLSGSDFYNRWEKSKIRKYNLFTFNCRSLLKN